jgi:hypothetical protein
LKEAEKDLSSYYLSRGGLTIPTSWAQVEEWTQCRVEVKVPTNRLMGTVPATVILDRKALDITKLALKLGMGELPLALMALKGVVKGWLAIQALNLAHSRQQTRNTFSSSEASFTKALECTM